jgi:hypothetical protein
LNILRDPGKRHLSSIEIVVILLLLSHVMMMRDSVAGVGMTVRSGKSTTAIRSVPRMHAYVRGILRDHFSMSRVILNRMVHFRVIITIRVHCGLIIRRYLMMNRMCSLSGVRDVMMKGCSTSMIIIYFSRSWPPSEPI